MCAKKSDFNSEFSNKKEIKGAKQEKLKHIEVCGFKFFPCNFKKNIKEVFVYFLLEKGCCGYWLTENNSLKFRNKEEIVDFVYSPRSVKHNPY